MNSREEDLCNRLGRYLTQRWSSPTVVSEVKRIPGGASRETWKCQAAHDGGQRGLIVRIDPLTSLLDTDRRVEYRTIEAVFKVGLPAPEPLFLEEDEQWLERPFSIMSEVTGCDASPDGVPDAHRAKLGMQKWTLLGQIAKLDPIAMGLESFMSKTTPVDCAMEQLDYWHKVIRDDELHPNPVAEAAIRWLKRNPPPPATKLSLVHGDYRTGNFLYSPEGDLKAILDWEMAHIGDPYEDLAWSLDPSWNWAMPELAGRLLPHKEAVRHWEAASGLDLDPQAFRWWQIFAAVKGIGIWISSSEDYHNGATKDPILAMAGWLMTDREQQILVDYLSPHSSHRFCEVVK